MAFGEPLIESCFRQNPWLAFVAIVASVALSFWAIAIDPVINNDGVFYILTAEYISQGEWGDALQTFKWPTYSFLIYVVQLLPGIGFEVAAHIVTTLGFTLAVLGFVAVTYALGARGRVLWLALVVVLIYPGINEFRSFLIRDSVFLALYMFALWHLFSYATSYRRLPLLWSALLFLLAALFRVEAAAFVFLFPVILINKVVAKSWRPWVLVVYVLVTARILAGFYGWWLYRPEGTLDPWTLLNQPHGVLQRMLAQISVEFSDRVSVARNEVLGGVPIVFAYVVTVFNIGTIVLRESIEALTVPYLLILLYPLITRKNLLPWSRGARRILVYVVVMQLLILVAFVFVRFFLAPRYPVALTLTLLLAVPFVLNYLLFEAGASRLRHRITVFVTTFLLLINTVEGLDSFSNKNHVRLAGEWLRTNISSDARVMSNDAKIVYYADRYREHWVLISDEDKFRLFLRSGRWQWKDYVVVNIGHRDKLLEELVSRSLKQDPIREFYGGRGDRIQIFYTADD